MRDENPGMLRTQSFKKLDRPMPTTERSADENAQHYLLKLIDTKRRLEAELNELNTGFDKYYSIYGKRLKELQAISNAMREEPAKKK